MRVYAANAYVSLADRFGVEHPEIVEMFDFILPTRSLRSGSRPAQNLQVLSRIAPERMWTLADLIRPR